MTAFLVSGSIIAHVSKWVHMYTHVCGCTRVCMHTHIISTSYSAYERKPAMFAFLSLACLTQYNSFQLHPLQVSPMTLSRCRQACSAQTFKGHPKPYPNHDGCLFAVSSCGLCCACMETMVGYLSPPVRTPVISKYSHQRWGFADFGGPNSVHDILPTPVL